MDGPYGTKDGRWSQEVLKRKSRIAKLSVGRQPKAWVHGGSKPQLRQLEAYGRGLRPALDILRLI